MAVGAFLLKVYGRDADSEFGILSFSLDNNGGNFFRIDEKSGEIFLNRQIDFETRRVHQVKHFLIFKLIRSVLLTSVMKL